MDYHRRCCWITVLILLVSFTDTVRAIEVSACHGTDITCDYVELMCHSDERIILVDHVYGYKDYSCNHKARRQKCFTSGSGCCVYDPDDCLGNYTKAHMYELYGQCSGRTDCGPHQVPHARLEKCDPSVSTYVTINYQCIPESTVIGFCDNANIEGSAVNIIYDNTTPHKRDKHTGCSCLLNAVDESSKQTMPVTVTSVDIRLARTDTGSRCSSSSVKVGPYSDNSYTVSCDETAAVEDNFVYQRSYDILLGGTSPFYIDLDDLYKDGPDDAPVMVWLSLAGSLDMSATGGTMSVTCFESDPLPTPTTTTTATSTTDGGDGPHNTTAAGATADDGGNTGVIVGVMVPLILLIAVGVVVGIVLWRRKHRPAKCRKASTDGLDYHGNRSSVANEVYDEIGFVPDRSLDATPPHATAGAPTDYRNNTLTAVPSSTQNGKTYENVTQTVEDDKESTNKTHKHKFKIPYVDIKAARMRLLSHFHRQNDQSPPPTAPKAPRGSYDHITAGDPVTVKITPAEGDSSHTYSHTFNPGHIPILPTQTNIHKKTPEPVKRRDVPNSDNIHAVQLTDSYIEFQFGDDDDKPGNSPRTARPNRPPPKPGTNPNMTANPAGLKAGISPQTSRECVNEPAYDYAENEVIPPLNRLSGGSDVSQHSYNIQDPEPVAETTYDYADGDADDLKTAPPIPDNIYEDVTDNKKAKSKKYKSASDLPQDVVGYLEPSVGSNRPRSIPAVNTGATQHSTGDTNPTRKQQPDKHTYINRIQENANLVAPASQSKSKSPILPRRAVATTDDQKAISNVAKDELARNHPCGNTPDSNEKSSVLKMAKLFGQGTDGQIVKTAGPQSEPPVSGYVNTRGRGTAGLSQDELGDLAAHSAVGRMSSDA